MASQLIYRISRKATAVISMAVLSCMGAAAQSSLLGGYFTEGYQYRYRINPAIQNDLGFFSIPGLGGIGVSAESNAGLKTFLYPDGKGNLKTFMSPTITEEEFVSGLPKRPTVSLEADVPVFSMGFKAGKTYHTLDISAIAKAATSTPDDLYKFVKCGTPNIEAKDLMMSVSGLSEIAYGVSTKITDNLSIGARAKFLIGVGSAEGHIDYLKFSADEDFWRTSAKGYYTVSGIVSMVEYEDDGSIRDLDLDLNPKNLAFGGALDLGVEWKINDIFTVSAALNDLGYLSWGNTYKATAMGNSEFEGFESDQDTTWDEQIEELWDQLGDALQFNGLTHTGSFRTKLSPVAHIGAEAKLPSAPGLSFGLLGSARFNDLASWKELRASVNYAPKRWFSASVSAAQSSFGFSAGALLSFHGRGISGFIGADDCLHLTRISAQGLPIDKISATVSAGLMISFGSF